MGQNFAGWARLKIEGPAGTHIWLKYAELINPDKTVNQISLRNIRATDEFILSGSGQEFYEPRFTFHGFRYVQVFGLPHAPEADTITGCVVRSDVEQVGSFECGNQLLNKLQSNICWTEQSNLHGVPTDCPQRDERLGWINDMTVRNECALFNFRLSALYTKWLNDIMDTQGSVTGAITDTAPFRVFGSRPSDPVGACLFLIPWNMYRHYGDINIIKNCYNANVKFLHYLKKNSTDYIMRWATMGDWAAPIGDNDTNSIGGGAVSMVTPPRLIATAFFYYDCVLMSKMAEVIGKSQDAEFYKAESQKVKLAFIKTYYNHEKKYVYSNSQGCNTIALYFDLIPQQDRKQVFDNLIHDIVEKHQTHITTGNICTRYLIEILFTNGYEDIAYELLTQTTYPSWGYMIENGATTIWERWEKVEAECSLSQMASHNHPMYGAVGVSFFKHLAGIDAVEQEPGFNKILIKPIIPSKLNHVKAKTKTIRGEVISEWKKTVDSLEMNISIPFNCTCELHVPSKGIPYEQLSITINGNKAIEKGKVIIQDGNIHQQDDVVIFTLPAGEYTIMRK
jgi:alpha-L-rhamnosidase